MKLLHVGSEGLYSKAAAPYKDPTAHPIPSPCGPKASHGHPCNALAGAGLHYHVNLQHEYPSMQQDTARLTCRPLAAWQCR